MTWKGNLLSPRNSDMKTPHVHQQQSKMGYLKVLWMCSVLFYTLTSQSEHNYSCRRVNSCHMPTWWFALWSCTNPRDRMHQRMLKFFLFPQGVDWTYYLYIHSLYWCHFNICCWNYDILLAPPFQIQLIPTGESLSSVIWHIQERGGGGVCSSLGSSRIKAHLANCTVKE